MSKTQPAPRDAAVHIVRTLVGAGYVAYLAGGCVRDELLGYHPKDYDVATDAHPETVKKLFPRGRYIGESFGVVQVSVKGYPHHPVEVATFRNEWGYEDGRRPTDVQFTDAENDAQRRDFTINGLFEDPITNDASKKIIDYVGGQADLQSRLVRAIGDPQQRFGEDYLRMLRAVRFATRLGFEIEPETAQAIPPLANNLARISRERIGQELMWMLISPPRQDTTDGEPDSASGPAEAIGLIQQLHLDASTLDEPHAETPLPTVLAVQANNRSEASAEQRDFTRDQPDYATYLAAWLLDRHLFISFGATGVTDSSRFNGIVPADAPDGFAATLEKFVEESAKPIIQLWRRALCLSNDDRDALRDILDTLSRAMQWRTIPLAKRKRLLARKVWPQSVILVKAIGRRPGMAGLIDEILEGSQRLLLQDVSPPPWVTGDDLIAAGFKPGPGFRRVLEEVYDAQLEGDITSRDQALAWVRRQQMDG